MNKRRQADRYLDRAQWIVFAAGLNLFARFEFTFHPWLVGRSPCRGKNYGFRLSHSARERKFGITDTDLIGSLYFSVAINIHSISWCVYHDPSVSRDRVWAVERSFLI